ncbi:crotonobetainyl-CoA:carnitine CoA-transferase CaiB-like acyl-CoA transferase [Nocardioides albertanoniae]|uniref:Crotonobetainyl-CoA:carnitine CoA-transferase CaiB-like acyl-CoA transferase n=1 Tax=Nocardioides albertanoniae TaxID=1175486 RepID=A0A543A7W4_9ACTN|nr:CaiB/BaiF CoA-transferase family protein [Nocardioides albertanoniae]TQL68694.1 crotonobetainyl-CoA:carnitine CoA-transferase CaiB-like acyl-CoA transferase [Nocardioides albertanoniae]
MSPANLPLSGVNVLDLSTLLPGPLATLMLAEAGADVVKLERPGRGDEMRSYEPRLGKASANYAILNRGKRAYAVDFKDPVERDRVLDIAAEADVVVEQFRPGVADRLGLGYAAMSERNPRVVYCSINGYGSSGPAVSKAGHDLNYLAESGLLGTVLDRTGTPALPVTTIADIAGGTYPALVNILLALRQAEATGRGCHVEVSMAQNLQTMAYGYVATHQAGGGWPRPGRELLTGGSPRYHVYPTSDGRHIACAALEEKFWTRLVELIGLDEKFHDDTGQEDAVIAALEETFAARPAEHWQRLLEGEDVCTVVVATWEEAMASGLVETSDSDLVAPPESPDAGAPTLRSPVNPHLRRDPGTAVYPDLQPMTEATVWREGKH